MAKSKAYDDSEKRKRNKAGKDRGKGGKAWMKMRQRIRRKMLSR